MKFLLGKKLTMTQIFREGRALPVTLVEVWPNVVTQVKNRERDGYQALQLGLEKITKARKIKKTMKGKEYRHLKEFRGAGDHKGGETIDLGIFNEGELVKVSGLSKGKGFQGAVKKWGFHGRLSSTHGTKHELRTLGSVGSSNPDRVRKGRRMSGRMGGTRASVKNLEIVKIDQENHILALKGAVPGRKGTLLEIKA